MQRECNKLPIVILKIKFNIKKLKLIADSSDSLTVVLPHMYDYYD